MKIVVANENLETVAIIDEFESLIWTDRYNKPGDFELYLSAHSPFMEYLKEDYYCFISESDYTMIIEGIEIRTNNETGDKAIITGRSLESILDRRIVWKQTNFKKKTIEYIVQKLVNDNVINPSDAKRAIPNFYYMPSSDEYITTTRTSAQYTGDNILDVVCEICEAFEIGFRVICQDLEVNGTVYKDVFTFELYDGVDRTYDQDENPYVIFSPKFDNIIDSDYIESNKTLKNITRVFGEGEGKNRKTKTVFELEEEPIGMERRELFTDARDVSSTVDDGQGGTETLSDDEYKEALEQRGHEKLAENTQTKSFAGEVESSILFVYGRDFFMGDIVQIENEFGISGTARVVEFVRTQDKDGIKMYPTFEAIE